MATSLNSRLEFIVNAEYGKTDNTINPDGILLKYNKNFAESLLTGSGTDKADILYYQQFSISSVQTVALDSLVDSFGETRDIDAIKCVLIENLNKINGGLNVVFNEKGEQVYIGPQGIYILWEPSAVGLISSQSESDSMEGDVIFTPNSGTVSFNFILIGALSEYSSQSGV